MPRLYPPTKEAILTLPLFAALPEHAIHIPATAAEFNAAKEALWQQKVLGFDTESKPLFKVGEVDTGPHVVQLATTNAAWILQLHHPQAMTLASEIVAAEHICKVGFGLQHDQSALPKRLGVTMNHIVDLDRVFKQHGYGASLGVKAAVAVVLGQQFKKSKRQSTSNWAKKQLEYAQIRYAANDAHAPAQVYSVLPQWLNIHSK